VVLSKVRRSEVKRRFIQLNGELHEVKDGEIVFTPMIQPDIKPYKSMVTGEIIDSRAKHREHLKRHGVVEVGNDVRMGKPAVNDSGRRFELIRAQVDAMPESQFRKALNRDIQNAKWNSRRS
jgi:hypothetical protein